MHPAHVRVCNIALRENAHGMELREVLLVAANLMAPGVAVNPPT